MSARPCRLCYGTGVRYVADQPDHLTAEPCPCLVPLARAYADAVDVQVEALLDSLASDDE